MAIKTPLLALLAFLLPLYVHADVTPTEEGFRVGVIESVSGALDPKTATGYLMTGHYMSKPRKCEPGTPAKPGCTTEELWAFQIPPASLQTALRSARGRSVVISYSQKDPFSPSKGENKAVATTVSALVPALAPKKSCMSSGIVDDRPITHREGQIVKVIFKGIYSGKKTWEITLQAGTEGGELVKLSTSEAAVFKCATQWLKSGERMLFNYRPEERNPPIRGKGPYEVSGLMPIHGDTSSASVEEAAAEEAPSTTAE